MKRNKRRFEGKRMKKLSLPAVLPLIFCCFTLQAFMTKAAHAKDELLDKVIAVVNDEIVLKSELSVKVFEQSQNMAAQNIPVNDIEALQRNVLNNMILEKLQLQRAKQLGLTIADEDINQQVQKIAEQNELSLFELRNRLNLQEINGFQNLRQEIKKQFLIQKLRNQEVISRAFVTESEIQNFLKRQSLSQTENQVKLSHILIALPESATPSQRETALKNISNIRQRIITGESFSQLAIRYSNGAKALQGGDLGWMPIEQTPTFFANEIDNLKLGDVSNVIQSPSGFHLIQLIDKRETQAAKSQTEYRLYRFVIPSDKAIDKVPSDIAQLAREMDSIQDFQALFKKYPDASNANSDLGWRDMQRIPPVIQQDVADLSPKNALPPLATDGGWMILYLDDVRDLTQATEEERKNAVQTIRMRKANEMFDVWLRRLRDEAFVQIK